MAIKVFIMGESGTGKSTSMRNLSPDEAAIVNPVGKPLPFRGSFETLDSVVEARKIKDFMKKMCEKGKKIIIVDDFQYILSVPYMKRINEAGWDKWNDFGDNYYQIIEFCNELPKDVTVYFMTHTETLENGVTTIKLIGKLLREKITIEGLFTIVLQTQVSEGNYYFLTQNSGKNTVKSPMGMFEAYSIENDLKYVDDKIRNYYAFDGAKTDAEIASMDKAKEGNVEKPRVRKGRNAKKDDETMQQAAKHLKKTDEAIAKVANGREEIPYDEVPPFMPEPVTDEAEEQKEPESAPPVRRRRQRTV